MAFFSIPDSNDVPVIETLEENTEVEVRCLAQEDKVGKESGNAYLNITLDPISHKNADLIYHMIFPPNGEEKSDKQVAKKVTRVKEVCAAFGVEYNNGFNPEHFVGQTAVGIIHKEQGDDGRYRNTIKQWVVQQ